MILRQKEFDYIIIGQGIAGSLLDFEFEKCGCKCLIIDQEVAYSASKASCGILNPITGRKFHLSWEFDRFWGVATETYTDLSHKMNRPFLEYIPIVRKIETRFLNDWLIKKDETEYAKWVIPEVRKIIGFATEPDVPWIAVKGARIDVATLLLQYRFYLKSQNRILEHYFDYDELSSERGFVYYQNYKAKGIIFAEGIGVENNPFFTQLPVRANPGEFVRVEIDDLKLNAVMKEKYFQIQIAEKQFWIGSYNRWDDEYAPTNNGLETLCKYLRNQHHQFQVLDHQVGVRAGSPDRRPMIGNHPSKSNFYVFNGLGTKGISLSPLLCKQFVHCIVFGKPLAKEVDINRFG